MSIDKRLISTGPAVCTTDTLDIFGDSSCVALYGLNYDASDAGGNYDGTATDVTFNEPGYIDYAASFNGSSSEVEVSSSVLNINTISISAWININTTSGYRQIVSNYATGNFGWGFRVEDGGFLTYNTTVNVVSGSTVLSTNTWYHAVLTIDSAGNSSKIYLNGSEDGSGTYTAPSYSGNTNFHIGSLGNINVQYFDGKIDQVRIFNKALSSSEVSTLYGELACEYTCTTDTNGFPASASSDLVAYYKLDNDATDETGTYNGTETSITYDGGRYGASASFNGSSSYVNTNNSNNYSTFSVSMWVNLSANKTYQTFYCQDSALSSLAAFYIGVSNDVGRRLSITIVDGSSTRYFADSGILPTTDGSIWYHIVAAISSTNAKIYVNGSLEGQVSYSSRVSATGNAIIGAGFFSHSVVDFVSGKIDQVRIFSKELSSTEVSTIYEDEHQCYITVDSTDPFGDSNNIALYEFENNANDSTGSYNGTASNVTYSTDSIIGTYAASFNGSSSTITLPITTSDLGANSACSISWWWKPSTSGTTIDFLFEANAADVFMIHTGGGAGSQGLRVGVKNTSETPFQLDVTNAYTTGVWQHHVATFGNNKIRLYKNGNLIGSLDYNGTIKTISNIAIGNRPSNAYWYSGELDQVRIFNRALNGDEVWKIYAEGAKG
jgi:hypothetical protein